MTSIAAGIPYLRQIRITTTVRCKNGSTLHIRQSTEAKMPVKKIYSLLQLPPPPGRTIENLRHLDKSSALILIV